NDDEDMVYMYNAYLHKQMACFLSHPLARDKVISYICVILRKARAAPCAMPSGALDAIVCRALLTTMVYSIGFCVHNDKRACSCSDCESSSLVSNVVMQPSYDFTYAVLVLITLGSCNLSTKKFNIFVCNNVIYRRNLFGRNGKLNPWLERGQIDSIFRINYTHPWIEGDDKRASRAIMIQVPNVLLPNVQLIIHLICLLHKLIFVSSTIRIQECQEHLFMEIMLTVTAI
ncbi:UNVERIFIED_CONTAM: Outer envelope protein 80, chloroplastic, partial [Sesamum indicum]